MGRRSGSRLLAAVLFTDIVDSTKHSTQLGDRRWKELIGRHHAIVRRELKRFGGRELDTAGDGFFASFGEPAAAIRCACAAAEAVRQLGIEIRAGVHFGECEQVGGKLGGLTVVIGARVMSLGGAGEVLTTASTRELVGGAELGFADRGLHALKGIEGEVHLFAVTDVDGTPRPEPIHAKESEQRLATIQPAGHRRLTPRRLVAIAAALLLTILIAVPWAARRAEGSSEIEPNSIGILDPDSGEVIDTVTLDARPGSVAASADSVWVTNPDTGHVTKIDPDERAVRDDIQVGEGPTGIAVGLGAVWVVESGEPSVSRIDADTGEVVDTIPVGNGAAAVAAGEGSVWVTNRFDGTVSRIDPDPGGDATAIRVGAEPQGIAIGFGSVWVGLAGSNTIVKIDPATNEATPIGVGNGPASLVAGGGAVWVANTLDDTVSRIDPETSTVVETLRVGDGPSGIAVVDGVVWVANEPDGTISRIEPSQTPGQSSVRGIAIGSVPQGLAAVNGDLWVSVRGTATSHIGGTLRLVSIPRPDSLDSSVNYEPVAYRVLHLLGDGLVALEPIGGTSTTLVPDLATTIPAPTNDGRDYTFSLRPDIPYSDGEIVAPADFRHALERVFRLGSGGAFLYEGIVGAHACEKRPVRCDLSQGIETDDEAGTITFHLLAPDPDFPYKLTLPFAFPAPPSIPDEEQGRAGIPGTGPYRLLAPMTDEGLTLVRNPSFHVWSAQAQPDGYVDRIEWTFGVEPDAQIDAVIAGEADVALDASRSGRLEEVLIEHAALVRTSPQTTTWYFTFRTDLAPFDQVEVRRAMNLAMDRGRFAQLLGGDVAARPTCQQLPPNFPGYEPFCPYTVNPGPGGEGSWTAPDMERAKEIVRRSDTTGMRVEFSYFAEFTPQGVPDYMLELLDDLGYRGRARSIEFGDPPGAQVQMVANGWAPDYPAASTFFIDIVTCDASGSFDGAFCQPQIDRMIASAVSMQLEDPVAAARLWAEIDRAVVTQAPHLWTVNPISLQLVSERVGNYQWSNEWNELLNQLWVR